jgi:alkylmercury lyase
MSNGRAAEMTDNLTSAGGVLDYGPERSRLLVRVMRALARGRPVSSEQVDEMMADIGIPREDGRAFLRAVAEQGDKGTITGALGLSLNRTAHRFFVNGAALFTWCAVDTLFLPSMLNQTAAIESESPVSRAKVRLRVGAGGVEDVSPAGTVISVVMVDPGKADVRSVEEIWGAFCHHIFFFASRAEAEQWAAGRDDIEILSPQEGFELGRKLSSRLLAHA